MRLKADTITILRLADKWRGQEELSKSAKRTTHPSNWSHHLGCSSNDVCCGTTNVFGLHIRRIPFIPLPGL